jgi:ABC-type nitrate/sulfonate/bicarbonate transport system substrate-binding protein
MRNKIVIILILTAFSMGAGLWSCSPGGYSGPAESITIGTIAWEPSALIYLAQNQGYFKANGLSVTIKNYDTGLATTQAMLSGEIDMAACAEYVIVEGAFQGKDIVNLATIAQSENELLIGRNDRGISTELDLKGKKIGLPKNTIAEFYLGRFLELRGMTIRDVILIDTPPTRLGDALADGSIDAAVAWQPYADQIMKRLPDFTLTWQVQSDQPMFWNITSSTAFAASHQQMVNRVMASLAEAEKYVTLHADESRLIVQKLLNYDATYISSVWSQNTFLLLLNQALILAMEDEARWMISNNLTAEKTTPNFLDYINADALKAVNPEAVNIIGK